MKLRVRVGLGTRPERYTLGCVCAIGEAHLAQFVRCEARLDLLTLCLAMFTINRKLQRVAFTCDTHSTANVKNAPPCHNPKQPIFSATLPPIQLSSLRPIGIVLWDKALRGVPQPEAALGGAAKDGQVHKAICVVVPGLEMQPRHTVGNLRPKRRVRVRVILWVA